MAWRGPNTPQTNPVPNNVNMPEVVSNALKTENRAKNVRRDTDKLKNFSVNLMDIDSTIIKYLNEKVSPEIVDNGQVIKVPINYASPEKWKSIKKDGYMRDKNGKIQCPAISLRRTTMQRNDQLITLNRYLTYPASKLYSEKNQYDRFSQMNDFAKTQEIFNVTAPDHVIINYDFIIWTDLIEQMNPIIEAINFSTEDYWGDKARYKFRTSISDYNFQTETVADSDRIVKTTFTMIVYAYLLPETFENHKQTVEKAFTPRKIVFDSEVTGDISTVGGKKKSKLIHVGLPSGSMQSPSTGTGGSQNAHVLWADRAGYAEIADFVYSSVIIVSSSYADSASLATTASYLTYQPNVPTVVSSLTILNGGAQSSLNTNQTTGVNSAISVDAIPVGSGNVASWMVSIFDGTNYQASEVLANWNNVGSAIDYAEISVNQIGRVPVFLSVIYNSGFIYLIATPVSGTWTVKVLRMTI